MHSKPQYREYLCKVHFYRLVTVQRKSPTLIQSSVLTCNEMKTPFALLASHKFPFPYRHIKKLNLQPSSRGSVPSPRFLALSRSSPEDQLPPRFREPTALLDPVSLPCSRAHSLTTIPLVLYGAMKVPGIRRQGFEDPLPLRSSAADVSGAVHGPLSPVPYPPSSTWQ